MKTEMTKRFPLLRRGAASATAGCLALMWVSPATPSPTMGSGVTEYRGETTVAGATVHASGVIKVTDTTVRFLAPHTELAAYLSDPSTNYFTDLTVGPGGYLSGGMGDVFVVSGNFTNNSTQTHLWNTASAELDFSGGTAAHLFALAGSDAGTSCTGYVNNFAWRTLRVAAGQSLTLGDGNANNAGTALYVSRLVLDGGIAQVGAITGNGANVYYDPADPANAPLLNGAMGGIYPLAGGGAIRPVQSAAKIFFAGRLANGHFQLKGSGTAGTSYTVQASTDLQAVPFAAVATITTDSGGLFTYEDTDSVVYPRRFYRVATQ